MLDMRLDALVEVAVPPLPPPPPTLCATMAAAPSPVVVTCPLFDTLALAPSPPLPPEPPTRTSTPSLSEPNFTLSDWPDVSSHWAIVCNVPSAEVGEPSVAENDWTVSCCTLPPLPPPPPTLCARMPMA